MHPSSWACGFTLLAVLASTHALASDLREEWQFNDRRGTTLTGLSNSAGAGKFNQDGHGMQATGDGALRIRRGRTGAALYHAPAAVEAGRPVWLAVDIRSWDLAGPADEAWRFGLSDGTESNAGLADIRMQRHDDGTVHIEGRGHGRGATRIEPQRLFAASRPQPLALALEVIPADNRYRIYYREPGAEWVRLGEGRTSPGRSANFVRLNVANRFIDTPQEHLDLARIAVTHAAVVDGASAVTAAPLPVAAPAAAPAPVVMGPPDLSLPPQGVSAVAWAVADANGRILASQDAVVGRKNASITKVMCALVIARLIDRDPAVMDERVTFSASAAATRGSRADLAEGESLTIREALFGLMLPSGNDAGNALAEHFNDRLGPPAEAGATGAAARRNFIAEMNRVAAELGMTDTNYRIAFGDGGSAEDHTSTAADLIKLARAAHAHPLVRAVFGTRDYIGTVLRPDGSERPAEWTNTNQLLGQRGFDGIKTGTTRTAGACLLSTAERDGVRVYAVVLGSTARELRFVDTEILCNWAWAKLAQER